MNGLAIATTVASRPTITIPRETVIRVHHGLSRMRARALGAMRRSSTAITSSHGATEPRRRALNGRALSLCLRGDAALPGPVEPPPGQTERHILAPGDPTS